MCLAVEEAAWHVPVCAAVSHVCDGHVSTLDLNGFYLSKELRHRQLKHVLSVEAASVQINTQPVASLLDQPTAV